jgi:hypothetical protein
MKGPDPREEMGEAEAHLKVAGMALAACRDVRLPGTNLSRKIITYKRASR